MTANRWWVRFAARWLARFDTVKGQIQAFSLVVTAFSTFSIVLQNAGLGRVVPYLGVAILIGGIVYTYYFAEGGVYNQKQRDISDIGDNYSGPTMAMDAIIEARQLAELAEILRSDTEYSSEELAERMETVTINQWADLRDGLDIEELQS